MSAKLFHLSPSRNLKPFNTTADKAASKLDRPLLKFVSPSIERSNWSLCFRNYMNLLQSLEILFAIPKLHVRTTTGRSRT